LIVSSKTFGGKRLYNPALTVTPWLRRQSPRNASSTKWIMRIRRSYPVNIGNGPESAISIKQRDAIERYTKLTIRELPNNPKRRKLPLIKTILG